MLTELLTQHGCCSVKSDFNYHLPGVSNALIHLLVWVPNKPSRLCGFQVEPQTSWFTVDRNRERAGTDDAAKSGGGGDSRKEEAPSENEPLSLLITFHTFASVAFESRRATKARIHRKFLHLSQHLTRRRGGKPAGSRESAHSCRSSAPSANVRLFGVFLLFFNKTLETLPARRLLVTWDSCFPQAQLLSSRKITDFLQKWSLALKHALPERKRNGFRFLPKAEDDWHVPPAPRASSKKPALPLCVHNYSIQCATGCKHDSVTPPTGQLGELHLFYFYKSIHERIKNYFNFMALVSCKDLACSTYRK